jgi:hypothetical protein
MKTLHKLFTAICLITIVGLVGCGDPKKTETKTGKTESQAKTDEGASPAKAEKTTEPMNTEPTPVEASKGTPEVDPDADTSNQESGSGEKKGGVDIPKE